MPTHHLTHISGESSLDHLLPILPAMIGNGPPPNSLAAIDAFFVRGGALLSTVAMYVGMSVLQLNLWRFATGNMTLALVSMCVATVRSARTDRRRTLATR